MRRRTTALGGAALAVGALGAAVLAALRTELEPMLVKGGSMAPTLDPGHRIAVGPLDRLPVRGELVVVRRAPQRGAPGSFEVVKRVVGLPGERVRLVDGGLEVDGRKVAEPYLQPPGGIGDGEDLDVTLGAGQYLVLGDHRAASTDGRDFGPVPASALVGRVRFAYWPPRRLRRRA
jgi:signal peptidase I